MRTLPYAIVLLLCLWAPALAQEPLTRVKAIRQRPSREQGVALPVRLQGLVLNRDAYGGAIYFWDGEDGIYADNALACFPEIQAGQEILLEGWTAPPGYAPNLKVSRIEPVGRRPLPEPVPLTAAQLLSDRFDCHYVQTSGRVRSMRRWGGSDSSRQWVLTLVSEGIRVNVLTPPANEADAARYIGARVLARGVCAHGFDSERRMVNAQLRLNSLEDLRVVDDASGEPPLVELGDVLRFRQDGEFGGPVRVRGTVVCTRPGDWLQIQDSEHGLRIRSPQDPAPGVGDLVEAVGYPEPTPSGPVMEDATFAKLGPGRIPPVVNTTAANAPLYAGRLIRIEGLLVEKQSDRSGRRLILRDHDAFFVAALPAGPAAAWARLEPGCRLAVSGLCQSDAENESFALGYPKAFGFSLHLNGGDDAVLLTDAPWWTPQRLTAALSVLVTALVLASFWGVSVAKKNALLERAGREIRDARDALARRVEARTDQLNEQIRARLEQRAAFAAVAAERHRMARELHDSLQQRLASAALRLDALRRGWGESLPRTGGELAALVQMMREGQDEVRRSVWDLRALALDRQTLAEAIRESARLLLEGTGLRAEVSVSGAPRELPSAAENHLLRITQEAVGNVLAHARASELRISLHFEPASLELKIEDDGVGFTPPAPGAGDTGHFGIADIRERVRALGGAATFRSAPDLGATVLVVAPL